MVANNVATCQLILNILQMRCAVDLGTMSPSDTINVIHHVTHSLRHTTLPHEKRLRLPSNEQLNDFSHVTNFLESILTWK